MQVYHFTRKNKIVFHFFVASHCDNSPIVTLHVGSCISTGMVEVDVHLPFILCVALGCVHSGVICGASGPSGSLVACPALVSGTSNPVFEPRHFYPGLAPFSRLAEVLVQYFAFLLSLLYPTLFFLYTFDAVLLVFHQHLSSWWQYEIAWHLFHHYRISLVIVFLWFWSGLSWLFINWHLMPNTVASYHSALVESLLFVFTVDISMTLFCKLSCAFFHLWTAHALPELS